MRGGSPKGLAAAAIPQNKDENSKAMSRKGAGRRFFQYEERERERAPAALLRLREAEGGSRAPCNWHDA